MIFEMHLAFKNSSTTREATTRARYLLGLKLAKVASIGGPSSY